MSAADVSIVVPCYNERGRLDLGKFADFARHHRGIEFLFVDDGSTDGTGEMLARFCRTRPGVFRWAHLPANRGKGEAVRQGVLAALASGPRYVGYWDADLATPLEAIPTFVAILDEQPGIELVMGSRVQLLGRKIERRPLRHYLGRMFATTVSFMLALRVYDTQCGAKLFRASRGSRALFEQPFRSRWLFDVELLARLIRSCEERDLPVAEEIIYELPLIEWRDVVGSKIRRRDFVAAPRDLARIYWRYFAAPRWRAADPVVEPPGGPPVRAGREWTRQRPDAL